MTTNMEVGEPAVRRKKTALIPHPFVKWAGGKSQLLNQLAKYFPSDFNRYYEPFVGGGAVFFHLRPKQATISDSNYELITTYKVIKDDVKGLIEKLHRMQHQKLTKHLYKNICKQNPISLPPLKRATRFIFLNKTCYNGLYRVNKNGEFNVPFGKYEQMPKLYDETNLLEISSLLRTVDIQIADYDVALTHPKSGDFVYLDPPYLPEQNTNGFTAYTKEAFSRSDEENLAKKFKELDHRGCLLMLSNSATTVVRQLFADYKNTTFELDADRMINCQGTRRRGYKELVILNYEPPSHSLLRWIDRT